MGKLLNTVLFLALIMNGICQFHELDQSEKDIPKQTLYSAITFKSDTNLSQDHLNFVTLVVDYDTYEFEGGDLSYYQKCDNCTDDSIPFQILVNYPGDFGDIIFGIQNTMDTIFFASIIWMGYGQIYHPDNYHFDYPFNPINNQVPKPNVIEYYDMYGSKIYDDPTFIQSADLAWHKIDSLAITHLFSETNYKVGIYLYPPTVGGFDPLVAKWVIFFYLNDYTVSIMPSKISDEVEPILIYPNPCQNYLTVESPFNSLEECQLEIIDLSGKFFLIQEFSMSEINTLDVSLLKPGVYIVKMNSREQMHYSKFIKY